MAIKEEKEYSPTVVGGLGGSGTRAVASILKELNFYLGSYLNEQLDNLWFTFLFRRPMAFRYFNKHMEMPLDLFDAAMKDELTNSLPNKVELYYIVAEYILCNYVKEARKKFPLDCAKNLLSINDEVEHERWGWKEPNSHLFIQHLHGYYPNMKYIHVLRHPMDMAYGKNFLQLCNWHHLFNLPKPNPKKLPQQMLAYYDAANTRAIKKGERLFGNNFLLIKLENLCQDEAVLNKLLKFIGVEYNEEQLNRLKAIPQLPQSYNRYKQHNWKPLEGQARDVCDKFGYDL